MVNYEIEQLPEELQQTHIKKEELIQDMINNLSATGIDPITITDNDINNLVKFLFALTDQKAKNMNSIVPNKVPSGLAVDNQISDDNSISIRSNSHYTYRKDK